VPVSATTVFQLGSISKQFLAALVLRLAERGMLSLDDGRNMPAWELRFFMGAMHWYGARLP
jgi:hypothetical protein